MAQATKACPPPKTQLQSKGGLLLCPGEKGVEYTWNAGWEVRGFGMSLYQEAQDPIHCRCWLEWAEAQTMIYLEEKIDMYPPTSAVYWSEQMFKPIQHRCWLGMSSSSCLANICDVLVWTFVRISTPQVLVWWASARANQHLPCIGTSFFMWVREAFHAN